MNIPFSSKSLGNNILKCIRDLASELSIQPKIPEISAGTSNGTDHFGLVRPEYSRPSLKVVLFDQSGHFCRSDRSVRFHLTKLLSPVPLFCILLARTITKRGGLDRVSATGMYRSIGYVEFPKFQTGIFFLMESALGFNLKLKLIQNFKLKTKTYLIFTAVCLSSTQGYV